LRVNWAHPATSKLFLEQIIFKGPAQKRDFFALKIPKNICKNTAVRFLRRYACCSPGGSPLCRLYPKERINFFSRNTQGIFRLLNHATNRRKKNPPLPNFNFKKEFHTSETILSLLFLLKMKIGLKINTCYYV
jgi:hypothetical protein